MFQTARVSTIVSLLLHVAMIGSAPVVAQILENEWPDVLANDLLPYNQFTGAALTHGPVLGRPTATSMRVWVRTAEPMQFRVVFDTQLPLTPDTKGVMGKTEADADKTGFVDLTGLRPNTRYYYGIVIRRGQLGEVVVDTRMNMDAEFPSFRTLPDAETFRHQKYNPKGLFNICFGTGFGNAIRRDTYYWRVPGFGTMLRQHGQDVMFYLNNGDNVYEVFRGPQNWPWDIALFREDYKFYFKHALDMVEFYRYIPQLFMFDDHDITHETGPGEVGLGKTRGLYRDIALHAWYEYWGWANFTDGSQHQALRFGKATVQKDSAILQDRDADFSTLRPEATSTVLVPGKHKNSKVYGFVNVVDKSTLTVRPAFAEDGEIGYTIGTHHYFDFRVSNCHFFVLDARCERTGYKLGRASSPEQFILGETQRHWLISGIQNTDADFIFIQSTVPWVIPHGRVGGREATSPGERYDKDGFVGATREREKLLDAFDKIEKPVIILSGDLHNAFVVQITDNVWEFMIGPMNSGNHPRSKSGDAPYGGWYDSSGRWVKVKWAGGFPDEVEYWRMRSNFYGIIQVNNLLKSSSQENGEVLWIAYEEPQVVVRVHDAYTGRLVYAEGISRMDAREHAGENEYAPDVR